MPARRNSSRRTARVALALAALLAAPALRAQERMATAGIEAGDAAWNAGRRDEALVRYREAVLADSATSSRAVFRLASLHAERDQLNEAIRWHRLSVGLAPQDDEGRVALARVLSWAGRYDEAVATYDSVLARDVTWRDAALGRARTLAWAGRLDAAVQAYRGWLGAHDADAEAWTGLGQVLRWSGRPREASAALRRALDVAPSHRDAIEQLRWVEVELSPAIEPVVAHADDSDENRSTLVGVSMSVPALGGGTLGLSRREARLLATSAASTTARIAKTLTFRGARLRLDAGAARLESSGAAESSALLGARAWGALHPRVSAGIGIARAPFDETAALISNGIETTALDGDVTIALPRRTTVALGGGVTRLTGGDSANVRTAAMASLRWAARRGLSIATTARTFGYERAARDGYFAPERYLLLEGSARAEAGRELGWGATLEAGLGRQEITPFEGARAGRMAQRASAALRWRPAPGFEYGASWWFANVAAPGTASAAEYRAWGAGIAARVKL
jgi:tetratricopeptide (TPR) repeat protein